MTVTTSRPLPRMVVYLSLAPPITFVLTDAPLPVQHRTPVLIQTDRLMAAVPAGGFAPAAANTPFPDEPRILDRNPIQRVGRSTEDDEWQEDQG